MKELSVSFCSVTLVIPHFLWDQARKADAGWKVWCLARKWVISTSLWFPLGHSICCWLWPGWMHLPRPEGRRKSITVGSSPSFHRPRGGKKERPPQKETKGEWRRKVLKWRKEEEHEDLVDMQENVYRCQPLHQVAQIGKNHRQKFLQSVD